MRNFWALGLAIGLAGCVAPPVFTIATLAFDGFSYVVTGKGVGDHALSMAMRQDCAMFRVLTEGSLTSVCLELDDTDGTTAIASSAPGPAGGDGLAAVARSVDDTAPAVRPVAFDTLAPAIHNRKAIYLVVGSFRHLDNAQRRVARLDGFPVRVTPAVVGGKLYHRVVAGPFANGDMADARAHMASAGVAKAWAINLCAVDLAASPCNAPTTVAQLPAPLNLAANDGAPPRSAD